MLSSSSASVTHIATSFCVEEFLVTITGTRVPTGTVSLIQIVSRPWYRKRRFRGR